MSDTRITRVSGRRIWDSRGRPTLEVDIALACGVTGRGQAPAGASRGTREAADLRDGGEHLGGFDVRRALAGISGEIAGVLIGVDAVDQESLDRMLIALDGTPGKSRLGGNALIATSLAALNATAAALRIPLWKYLAGACPVRIPLPEIQIFGGGAHAGHRVDVQDFMVMPLGASSFAEGLEWVAEIYRAAGTLLRERGVLAGVADEGGHWPSFGSNEEALETMVLAIARAGFDAGSEIGISLDIAASELRVRGDEPFYRLALESRELDSEAMIEMLCGWLDRYPIVSIEDPLAEDDEQGWRLFMERVSRRGRPLQVIGDDLLVTNAALVELAAQRVLCNAVLVKPNQAGTVTETHAALQAGQRAGMATIVSARSGETEDATIAHLAVGWNAGQLKVGSFARSERLAKWNEVIRIEEQLGSGATYAGRSALAVSTIRAEGPERFDSMTPPL
ncbi:MAG: phosphopyruvate hydratase [Casimicrobiaceae bacterium]